MKDRRIGKHISIAYRLAVVFFKERMSELGLHHSHHGVLFSLYKQDGVSQEKLSKLLSVDKATITRSIKMLVENGFIERRQDKNDKRSFLIFLTEKGRSIQPDIDTMFKDWNKVLLDGFDDDEAAQLIEYLQRVSKNVLDHHQIGQDKRDKECCNACK